MRARTCKQCFAFGAWLWVGGWPFCSQACADKRDARRKAPEVPTSPSTARQGEE